jgi:hypothetical protein
METLFKTSSTVAFFFFVGVFVFGFFNAKVHINQLESRKPIKPIMKITTDGVKSDTVYIYQKP